MPDRLSAERLPAFARYGILLFSILLFISACGGTNTPHTTASIPPTPTPNAGQQLLAKVNRKFNDARTLQGIFVITGSGSQFNGTARLQVWNAQPNKSRTEVLQSTISQLPGGELMISNGKQQWDYEPSQKVVYTGPASSSSSSNGSQTGSILDLVRSVFTADDAALVSSSAQMMGYTTSDVRVSAAGLRVSGISSLIAYTGDVYIKQQDNLPARIALNIRGFGPLQIDIPSLVLNQPIADSMFTFTVPPGVKVLPLQQANTGTASGMLTLAQAEQQAGYHLLSIPASQSGYDLQGIIALGSPGSQVFTFSYTSGSLSFTLAEGKPLANLPANGGQSVPVRGTTGTLTIASGTTTLAWTEKGIGITITGNNLSSQQVQQIAKMLI